MQASSELLQKCVAHKAGVTVTLTGPGDKAHLLDNLRFIEKPPLPRDVLEKLTALFGNVARQAPVLYSPH